MMLAMFALICAVACNPPVQPDYPVREGVQRPDLAPPVPTDSSCRTLTFTSSGNNGIAVTFPDRASCPAGLVLIAGGPATRSGGGGKNANIPVRLLNRSGYPIHSPATLVLAPGGREVLVPSGQPATKITPQNADSVRSGAWVWLVGTAGSVPSNDSTTAKLLVIRLDSPATSAQLTFTVEAVRLVGNLWPLVTDNIPAPDTTKLLQRPGTSIVYYRVDGQLRFDAGVSDPAKQAFFIETGVVPLGVTETGLFFVRFPDQGTSIAAYDAYFDQLNARPEVHTFVEAVKSGLISRPDARIPNDGAGQSRVDWLTPSAGTGAMRAVRAQLGWGCETGDYGGTLVKMGLVEFDHQLGHPELSASVPILWRPPDASLLGVGPDSQAARDRWRQHAAATGSLLAARGDNGVGIAGVMWRARLYQYALTSAGNRTLSFLRDFQLLADRWKADQPRVLSISVDWSVPPGWPAARQSRAATDLSMTVQAVLDAVPNLLIVVSAATPGTVALAAPM